LLTAETVAVNWALLDPAATVTLAGTLTLALPLDKVTANPPVEAASFSVTVQEEVPGAFTLAGVQDRVLNDTGGGGCKTVIVPPVPDAESRLAAAFVTTTPLSATGRVVLAVPPAILKATLAIVPLPMLEVPPQSMQVMDPLPLAHCRLLPAAEGAGSMVAATLAMSGAEYPIVHCKPEG